MGAAIGYAIQLLGLMPSLIQAGQSLMPLIKQGQNALGDMQAEGRGPTDEEWDVLNKARDAVHAQLQSGRQGG